MWQKTDPRELRTGISQKRPSEWFSTTQTQAANFFVEDIKIREFVEKFYFRSGISKVVIRKTDKEGEILLFTAKPAVVIGKEGEKLAKFEKALKKAVGRRLKSRLRMSKYQNYQPKLWPNLLLSN